jgi:hypothetical protein
MDEVSVYNAYDTYSGNSKYITFIIRKDGEKDRCMHIRSKEIPEKIGIMSITKKMECLKQAKENLEILKNRYINFNSIIFEEFENAPIGHQFEEEPMFDNKEGVIYEYFQMAQRKKALYKDIKAKDCLELYRNLCEKGEMNELQRKILAEASTIEQELIPIRGIVENYIMTEKQNLSKSKFSLYHETIWHSPICYKYNLFALYFEIQRLRRIIAYLSSEIEFENNCMF